MKKRWIPVVLLSIAALLFSALFVLHGLIETRINETGVVPARITLLESETGFILRHGAIRYEFLRGMVLTGISISGKNAAGADVPLLTGGQAVLGFPLLSIFSAKPRPDRLTIYEGQLYLKNLAGTKAPGDRLTLMVRFLRQAGMELRLRNLQLEDLADPKDPESRDLRLQLNISFREKDRASIKGELSFQDQPALQFNGPWKEAPQERIFLHIESMPVRLLYIWRGAIPFFPEGVSLKDGHLSGDGSIDLTNDGYALNLHGNYDETGFTLPGLKGFEAKKLKGDFEQMIVGGYTKGVLHSRLKVHSGIIDHVTEIDTDPVGQGKRYHFQGSLRLKPDPNVVLPLPVEADLDYNIVLEKKALRDREDLRVSVDAKLKRLLVSFSPIWPSIAPLKIENGIIKGDNIIAFGIPGSIGGTEFRLGGRIVPEFYRVQKETFFKHRTDFSLDIKEVSLHDLVHETGALSDDLIKYVKSPEAVQAEDSGPVWENKFITHPLYRRFVEPASIEGQIHLLHIKDTSPDMPSSLSLQFRHRIPATELLLQPVSTDSTKLQGHYRILYDATLPQHSASLELQYTGPGYTTRAFCDEKIPVDPVRSVDLKYTFQAEGMYLADLYFKSVTAFYLKMKHVPAGTEDRADLLRRMTELESPGIRYVDLDIENHSAGSLFKPIILKIEDDEAALAGTGEFNVYEGGSLQFQYFLKQKSRQGRFSIRLRQDRVWIPSS